MLAGELWPLGILAVSALPVAGRAHRRLSLPRRRARLPLGGDQRQCHDKEGYKLAHVVYIVFILNVLTGYNMRSRRDIRQHKVCGAQRLEPARRFSAHPDIGKKKAPVQLGEKYLPGPTRPGWGYRAESPAQGGRAGTFITNVPAMTRAFAESSNDTCPGASMLIHRQSIAFLALNARIKDLDQSHDKNCLTYYKESKK